MKKPFKRLIVAGVIWGYIPRQFAEWLIHVGGLCHE